MNLRYWACLTDSERLLAACRALIPPLTSSMYKGQAGRVGVIGGSLEYTGAPYFAGISALKVGADLAHIFCPQSAAGVIKSYSPELIVHPLLDVDNALNSISEWIPRIHSFVIGPGLGREPKVFQTVDALIEKLKAAEKLLVLDADALFYINQKPELIKGYRKAILTPNAMEFARLSSAVFGKEVKPLTSSSLKKVSELAGALGNVTILHKGAEDVVSNGKVTLSIASEGSNRRCGGQGDLLAGALATFFHWAAVSVKGETSASAPVPPELLAVYGACKLTRECAKLAFAQQGRSMTTTDMVGEIHRGFTSLFGE